VVDRSNRAEMVQWTTLVLLVVGLETHLVRRPLLFLLGPFLTPLFLYFARVPIPKPKQFWLLTIAFSLSAFLLAKYMLL
jgi:hypothetical protein